MNVHTFMNTLLNNPDKTIAYHVENDFSVEPFIHMTEIKNHVVESMDCGGEKNNWNETVMQLWTGSIQDDGHRLDSTKLLSILTMIGEKTDLDLDSELFIEYGNQDNRVAQYSLELDSIESDSLHFNLVSLVSQCKGMNDVNNRCASSELSCCSSVSTSCCV